MGQPVEQPQMPVGPVPTMVNVAQAMAGDGQQLVMLTVSTPVGSAVYFLDGAAAVQIGNALCHAGKASAANLVLPNGNGHIG
jgi:hypothetical protein